MLNCMFQEDLRRDKAKAEKTTELKLVTIKLEIRSHQRTLSQTSAHCLPHDISRLVQKKKKESDSL